MYAIRSYYVCHQIHSRIVGPSRLLKITTFFWKLIGIQKFTIFPEHQKGPSSPVLRLLEGKAAAAWAGGVYKKYVSTAKGRERRWRPFSTLLSLDIHLNIA